MAAPTVKFSVPLLSIDMPVPLLGDSRTLEQNLQKEFDMNGKMHTWLGAFTDTILNLSFDALPRNKALELRNFALLTAGNLIHYLDQDGVPWQGFITTDPFTIASKSNCNDTITIDFEGTKVA